MHDESWDSYKDHRDYIYERLVEQEGGEWAPQPRELFEGPVVEKIIKEIEKENAGSI
jgi:hypothetical protein